MQNNKTEKFISVFEFYRVKFELTDSAHNILIKRAYHQNEQIVFLVRLKLVQHIKINVSKRNVNLSGQFVTPLRKKELGFSFVIAKLSCLI